MQDLATSSSSSVWSAHVFYFSNEIIEGLDEFICNLCNSLGGKPTNFEFCYSQKMRNMSFLFSKNIDVKAFEKKLFSLKDFRDQDGKCFVVKEPY